MFVYCLSHHNMLCWGVYRLKDTQVLNSQNNKRYVICNPSADFQLIRSDYIYVLEQFSPTTKIKNNYNKTLNKINKNEIDHLNKSPHKDRASKSNKLTSKLNLKKSNRIRKFEIKVENDDIDISSQLIPNNNLINTAFNLKMNTLKVKNNENFNEKNNETTI